MHLSIGAETLVLILGTLVVIAVVWSLMLKKNMALLTRQFNEQLQINNELHQKLSDRRTWKREWLLNISHELRTPLHVILSALQLQENSGIIDDLEELRANDKRICALVKNNSYRLLRVINNLIDINKIDANVLVLKPEPVNLGQETRKVFEAVKPWFQKKAVSLSYEEAGLELNAVCDPAAYERVLLNLLSNALKFTPAGGYVLITAIRNRISGDVVISVRDSGIGIPESSHHSIFERYMRLEHDLVRNTEGNGLGLSIVKSLVELEGGSVQILSAPMKGAEFRLSYPWSEAYETEENKGAIHRETLDYRVLTEFSEIIQI